MAKRALLVGVNRYQIAGADLRGCVNDVKNLSAALIEFHGFKRGDITVLTDGAATKRAMQAGIKALVRDSKKGDVALLHFSGHGSHVPDDIRDESDGRDEILCPGIWTGTIRCATTGCGRRSTACARGSASP